MAQTKKRRRRKRRGTQGGRIDTRRRQSRPRSRAEARAQAKAGRRAAPRADRPPTWRSSSIRGVVAALVFTILLLAMFKRPVGEALGLGAFMLVFYIPAGYYIDSMMWRRRERGRIKKQEKR